MVEILIGLKIEKDNHLLNEPDQSYGGAVWTDAVPVLTGANIPFVIRLRVVLLRDTGSSFSAISMLGKLYKV